MKVVVKKVDALRREMNFDVSKERVAKKNGEVVAEFVKHAKLPGFRPGKAPRSMVESAHGKAIKEEMLKNLVPEVYQEGLIAEKLEPIDFPSIDNVQMKDGGLSFRASFDLRPEFEVSGYKGIKLTRKPVEVTEEEIAKTLEFFKKGRGLDENTVMDDAFAKTVGFQTMDEFKTALKRNLEFDKERQNRADVENQLIEELVKKYDFPVPQSLVDRQYHGRLEEFARRLQQYGAKEDAIAKKVEEASKDLRASAEKDVKTFLILQKIAGVENVTSSKEENLTVKVIEFLMKEAKWEEPSK
jgi:FKBP-type peptidyl-prolyl cis-trans isomerase (trigger factor)